MRMSSTMSPDMDMGMKMYFHVGYQPYVLIKQWVAETDGAMFGSCVFFFVLAILYELLKYYRQIHLNKAQCVVCETNINPENGADNSRGEPSEPSCHSESAKPQQPLQRESGVKRSTIKMFSTAHLIQTGLHVLQVFISYLLMLAFMLFNIWICLAVLLGAGSGYFLIGTKKVTAYTPYNEDHCHM